MPKLYLFSYIQYTLYYRVCVSNYNNSFVDTGTEKRQFTGEFDQPPRERCRDTLHTTRGIERRGWGKGMEEGKDGRKKREKAWLVLDFVAFLFSCSSRGIFFINLLLTLFLDCWHLSFLVR